MLLDFNPNHKVEWEQDSYNKFRGSTGEGNIFWITIGSIITTLEVPKELSGTGQPISRSCLNPSAAQKLAEKYYSKAPSIQSLKVAK